MKKFKAQNENFASPWFVFRMVDFEFSAQFE